MKVGVCKVRLRIPENESLKGKRRALKSLTTRTANKFNVSIAEVEDQELWQLATIGFSYVGNDASHVNQVLSRVVNFIGYMRGDMEMLDYEIEILDAL
ncbi:MAG: DUF503 domain-containing protein [Dehalococcoidia bacterium]